MIKTNFDIETERRKILDGTYPARIIQGRQNKHIEGSREFEQNCVKRQKESPGSRPSILTVNAKMLVERFKGTGAIEIGSESVFPRETIDTGMIVGKTWVKSLQIYVDTRRIKIIYSSKGVHVIPVSDFRKGLLLC